MNQAKMKAIYVITGKDDRKFWNKIGVAFVNRDGSLNCKLASLPVDGELHIRDFVPREERLVSPGRLTGPQAIAS